MAEQLNHITYQADGRILVRRTQPALALSLKALFGCCTGWGGWIIYQCSILYVRMMTPTSSLTHTCLVFRRHCVPEKTSPAKISGSVKDRDMEIVRLRHREQASGGWLAATQSGGANVAGRAPSVTAAAAAGVPLSSGPSPTRFMTPSPRGISRGEQAGQAVIARLSRLQATAAGTAGPGVPGGVGVPGGMRSGVGGHIHSQQAELQMQMRRYHQAMMAVGGTAAANSAANAGPGVGGGGQGSGGNGGRGRPCVQVAQ